MSNVEEYPNNQFSEELKSMILTIRGMQVMLDSDLATLYGVETKNLNKAVTRNLDRFPVKFRFKLNKEESESLRFQIGTLKNQRGQHPKYLPHVFTEQGVAMLSAVLRSATAIDVSVKIMDAFVEMRRFLQTNGNIYSRLVDVEKRQLTHELTTHEKFEKLFNALGAHELPKKGVFYNGQVYDSYSFTCDLIRSAKKSIVLLDNFVDDTVLTLLSKRRGNVTASIYTKNVSKQLKLDLEKHNEQYPEISVTKFSDAHDRFLIIDEKDVYHIGASLKDLGKTWFAFSKFEKGAVEMLSRLQK